MDSQEYQILTNDRTLARRGLTIEIAILATAISLRQNLVNGIGYAIGNGFLKGGNHQNDIILAIMDI